MKKFFGFLTLAALAVLSVSCNTPEAPVEKAPAQGPNAPIMIPEGTYLVDPTKSGASTINVAKSYVKRLVGSTQYHYDLVSGSFNVGRQADFRIVWDLYDDAEASYNITGEWTGPVTTHTSAGL